MAFSRESLLFGIGLVALFFAGSLYAEIPPEWNRPRQEIADAWYVRKEITSVGNDPLGAQQLEQIRKLQRRYDLIALPSVSLALLRELEKRGTGQREERLRYAEGFAPEHPAVAYFQCRETRGVSDLFIAIRSCLQGLKWELSRNEGKLRFLANFFFSGLHAFLWVSLAFSAFLLFRYGIPMSRALSQSLRHISPSGAIFLTIFISGLAGLYLGWIGPTSILFFLLWRYVNRGERLVLLFLWILAALLPVAMVLPSFAVRYERNLVSVLENPFEGALLSERAATLERWISEHPDDAEALFTLARIERETGRPTNARELYKKVSALRPDWHKPIVNLAVIEYIEKSPDAAVSLLKKAVSVAPHSVVAHFDLGKIYLNQTRLDEARDLLKKSKDIDPQLFSEANRISDTSEASRFLVDESLSPEELAPRIWGTSPDLYKIRDALFHRYFPKVALPLYWGWLAFVWVLSLALNQQWPAGNVLEGAGTSESLLRSRSLDIFDPNMSKAFKREYSPLHAFWGKFQERWCTFVLPGLHNLFRGNHVRAVFWLFASMWILVLLFKRSGLIPNPNLPPDLPAFPFTAVALAVFGLMYVFEAVRAVRS